MDGYIINYTTINHTARLELGITNTEYVFLDLICNLSNDPRFGRWCIAKKTTLAKMAEISEQHVHRLIKKFTTGRYKVGENTVTCPLLLERDPKTKNIRTTLHWYETVIIKKELIQKYREDRKQKLTPSQSSKASSSSEQTGSPSDFATKISTTKGEGKKDLNHFIMRWKEINPLNYEKFFKIKSYREAEQKLLDALGADNLDLLHDKLPEINKTPFVTGSYNPSDLLRNYPKYKDQSNKRTTNGKTGKRMIVTTGGQT